MKPRQIAEQLAKREGHKSQARMGDLYEVVGLLADMMYESAEVVPALVKLGIDRAKRKKKKES